MKYWVLDNKEFKSKIDIDNDKIILKNGLVLREIDVKKCSTIRYENLITNINYIEKEITDIDFIYDNKRVGKELKFLEVQLAEMIKVVDYFPNNSMSEIKDYPPKGKAINVFYKYNDLIVTVHYEIYDGIPTIGKKVTIKNMGDSTINIDNIFTDIMAIKNVDSLFVDSNFNSAMEFLGLDMTVYAKLYARYNYGILEFSPKYRMNVNLAKGETVDSIIAYETSFVADYYEARLIEVKNVYKVLAPWILDCALFFHLLSNDSKMIKKTVDQCAEVGLEMIIQSFGSGVEMESKNKRYLNKIKDAYEYGHSKNIRMGAYTLAYVKNYRPVRSHEALNHDYSHICRCLANDWAKKYVKSILNFLDATKADAIEIDGPYGMLLCSGGETHHHSDFTDSQYHQWKLAIDDWYKEIRKRNVYINAPDWHFLNGTNRTGIGYEEIAFSEKRMEQLVTSRIYYYKGTFAKTPSQGWGFVPLTVYHGGGKDAQFSPTNINSFEYDWALAQIVASGVWPTLRGKKVYDSEVGKEILAKWVAIYKKYRSVINGTTVHFMPPRIDKNNLCRTTCLDAIMNLVPTGENRGFLMFFNQTDKAIEQTINVPLYYSGLTDLKMPPPPFENTKNSDVTYPVYGYEPTPLVILSRGKNNITFVTDNPVIDKPIPKPTEPKPTNKKVCFSKNEKEDTLLNIDSNGNASLKVSLPAMSYCYYIIKEVK